MSRSSASRVAIASDSDETPTPFSTAATRWASFFATSSRRVRSASWRSGVWLSAWVTSAVTASVIIATISGRSSSSRRAASTRGSTTFAMIVMRLSQAIRPLFHELPQPYRGLPYPPETVETAPPQTPQRVRPARRRGE